MEDYTHESIGGTWSTPEILSKKKFSYRSLLASCIHEMRNEASNPQIAKLSVLCVLLMGLQVFMLQRRWRSADFFHYSESIIMGGGTLFGKCQPCSKATMCPPIIHRGIAMAAFKGSSHYPDPKMNEGRPIHVALLSSTRWAETGDRLSHYLVRGRSFNPS